MAEGAWRAIGVAPPDDAERFLVIEAPDGKWHVIKLAATIELGVALLGIARSLFPSDSEYRKILRRTRSKILGKIEVIPIALLPPD